MNRIGSTARPGAAPLEAATEPAVGSLSEQAYSLLRQDIMRGALAPATHIKIAALQEMYGIGPTPLREALSRLVAEGMVNQEANRGFWIPAVSMADLRDIVHHRKILECSALEAAINRGDDEWESRVLAAYHRMTRVEQRGAADGTERWEEWEVRHRDFHAALASGANSTWSQRLLRILSDQGDRYRRIYLGHGFIGPEIQDDHKQILDATLRRDATDAVQRMANHVERLIEGAERSRIFEPADAASA